MHVSYLLVVVVMALVVVMVLLLFWQCNVMLHNATLITVLHNDIVLAGCSPLPKKLNCIVLYCTSVCQGPSLQSTGMHFCVLQRVVCVLQVNRCPTSTSYMNSSACTCTYTNGTALHISALRGRKLTTPNIQSHSSA